jgi:hypothetical protein
MAAGLNRRSFLHLGTAAGAAILAPRWAFPQASQAAHSADPLAKMRAAGAATPIKTTNLKKYIDMLSAVRDNVAALKKAGASEQEVIAKKPAAQFDPDWLRGDTPDMFIGIVYRTI